MFGRNPKLPVERGDGLSLKVHSVFWTIQGEGPYVCRPAVFIRLSGCNLACGFCDTEFDQYSIISIKELVQKAEELCNFSNRLNLSQKSLVVITGGEPFRQDLTALCELLIENGFEIQIETNGLLYCPIPENVKIICSPKNQGRGYQPIRQDVLVRTIAIKFLISTTLEGYQDIAEVGQEGLSLPVYVQPIDEYDEEKNRANLALAMRISQQCNHVLSIQIHKTLGLP